ncbi:MAG: glycosidase [Chloroflexi bacterium]|nr:glycosidase [Chloroflexota bacterium]
MTKPLTLTRYPGNPVLTPSLYNEWETDNVFNAAVIEHDGLVYMLYRAQGLDRISRIGCAISTDGYYFNRLAEPVFVPETPYEEFGVEDPRITRLDGVYYMLYTAYSSEGTRVSLAHSTNLIAWERLGIILPDEDNKDALLFPEKIGGQYVMFHRRVPDIWLAYSDDLVHWTDHQIIMKPRPGLWDGVRIGAGGPPFKTAHGWLNFYHGFAEERIYCLGVALHDLEDPANVLKRQEEPVLCPRAPWEVYGDVPNVVFTCGGIETDTDYLIYYGGGDHVMAVATVDKGEAMAIASASKSDVEAFAQS